MSKIEELQEQIEHLEWEQLAKRGELAGMNRHDVAAIRNGWRLVRMIGRESLEDLARARGIAALTVDSYEQDAARKAAGT